MSESKIFKVTAAPGPGPKTIQAALVEAEKTGQLTVPGEAMCLAVHGGKIEVTHAG